MQHEIHTSVSIKAFNTFGVEARAERFAFIPSQAALLSIIAHQKTSFRILGGGSNILFTQDADGMLLKNEIKGKEIWRREEESVIVKIGGGENWHAFVLWCLDNQLGGVENLSLIPGTVGAAPIQNIGAYGVELKDVFYQLDAIRLSDGRQFIFSAKDCKFGYRDSIFKRALKGLYFITQVYLRLSAKNHGLHLQYGAIQNTLSDWGIQNPNIRDLSRAVVHIRQSKLPDPTQLGNAGSFFKNPVIDKSESASLKKAFPDIVSYPQTDGRVKLPAGWLVEKAGWKGKRFGSVGCYDKQALVIVNHGGATGKEIWAHAQKVRRSVKEQFGIWLETEVNVW